MHAPRANYAQVYVNGQYMGLYTNVEAVTKTFLESTFQTNNNTFFYADNGGCNFVYKGPDSSLYFPNYTLKSDYGWNDLVLLCNTLKNNMSSIETVLDVDRTLWMLALTNAMVILDSYIGQPSHNFYVYRDHNGRFNPVIWDLNGGFGVFNNPGNGPAYNVSQMQNMSPWLHVNDSMWPLVNKLLNIPRYKKMYIAHMRTILNEQFTNNNYFNEGMFMQSVADTAVLSDPNKFFTYSQFLGNLNNNVISGPKTIPGITLLMNVRKNYLNSTVDFQQIPPDIISVQSSVSVPPVNSNVFITAEVSNATAVFLGVRHDVLEKFNRVMMFDDGLNGDGLAGDGIYGLQVPVNTPETHYYIYAENGVAGIFSPQRAEHEYYILYSGFAAINAGDIVVNEFMAINNTTVSNSNGSYGDWIELYNNTSADLELDFVYLSDDSATPYKWQFPSGTTINAGSFLIVWADEETGAGELHCNFKLSGGGEQVILSYPNGFIIDSISFTQQQPDITFGRYPNGTGPFVTMQPTFNNYNSITGVAQNADQISSVSVYPNPSDQFVFFEIHEPKQTNLSLIISDVAGREVMFGDLHSGVNYFSHQLHGGLYFYKILSDHHEIGSGKLIIL